MGALTFIGSVFLSLLPSRYREGMKLRGPAMMSAFLEVLFALVALIDRILVFLERGQGAVVSDKVAKEMLTVHGGKFLQAYEVASFPQFWLSPINIFLYYLMFEGMVRY